MICFQTQGILLWSAKYDNLAKVKDLSFILDINFMWKTVFIQELDVGCRGVQIAHLHSSYKDPENCGNPVREKIGHFLEVASMVVT